jgi:hypothetical protein
MKVIINRKYDRDPYLTACEAIGAIPITFISQNLTHQELMMKHHGLGILGARAFGKVLEVISFPSFYSSNVVVE